MYKTYILVNAIESIVLTRDCGQKVSFGFVS